MKKHFENHRRRSRSCRQLTHVVYLFFCATQWRKEVVRLTGDSHFYDERFLHRLYRTFVLGVTESFATALTNAPDPFPTI